MAMLGTAALVLWFDVAPEARAELAHWHAHEHFPERLSIPGFHRGSCWTAAGGGDGFFVIYELQDHAVLASAPYLASLNAPSAWSTRMMPLHRGMVRTQCHVELSRGAVTARHALAVRCSPADRDASALRHGLARLADAVVARPGLVGLHVLRHDAPAIGVTTEQRIRGLADRAADWVVVACGYDLDALRELQAGELGDPALQALGCRPGSTGDFHTLAYAATAADLS
jgi:hypothetical protein